jgi:hypothetical protein
MKFESIVGRAGSYIKMKFSPHDSDAICYGDVVWSDGVNVEIHETARLEDVNELLAATTNNVALRGAFRRMGIVPS